MTVTLTDAIQAAKQREQIARWDAGEARLAAELKFDVPRPTLAKDVLGRLDIFGEWAASKSVRKCPAKPHVVAAFCIEQHQMGAAPQVILAMLAAVEALHDYHGLSNPVRTSAVRAALDTIIKVDPPRSWPREDKVRFAQLDPDIRQVIAEREALRDRALRRAQNEAVEAKKRHSDADEFVIKLEDKSNDCAQTLRQC